MKNCLQYLKDDLLSLRDLKVNQEVGLDEKNIQILFDKTFHDDLFFQCAVLTSAHHFGKAQEGMIDNLVELHKTLSAVKMEDATVLEKVSAAEHAMLLDVCLCLTDC